MKNPQKIPKNKTEKIFLQVCSIILTIKSFNKHLSTTKHLRLASTYIPTAKNPSNFCEICGKNKHRQSLLVIKNLQTPQSVVQKLSKVIKSYPSKLHVSVEKCINAFWALKT